MPSERPAGLYDVLVRVMKETARVVREHQEQTEQCVTGMPPQRPPCPLGSKKKRRKRR
ncbi:hypothetical protein ACWD0A_34045 [Streptomyces sp. NPDC002867]